MRRICPISRIEGPYDIQVIKWATHDLGGPVHTDYGEEFNPGPWPGPRPKNILIDCRPLSFNFLQTHILCEEFIPELLSPLSFTLLFDNEADFIVEKIISDLEEAGRMQGKEVQISLEFVSEDFNPTWKRWKRPIVWRPKSTDGLLRGIESVHKDPFVQGITTTWKEGLELTEDQRYQDFFESVRSNQRDFAHFINLKSLSELGPPHSGGPTPLRHWRFSFEFGPEVEINYRCLDWNKLSEYLPQLKGLLEAHYAHRSKQ